jgi:hypothetical protein
MKEILKKYKNKKMFYKIFIVFGMLLKIQPILSLNSTDFCFSLICKGNHSHQCAQDLCAKDEKTCNDYYRFNRAHLRFSRLNILSNYKSKIKMCESSSLNRDDFCLISSKKCFKRQNLFTLTGFKAFEKKVDCKCKSKLNSFKCGDYCTLNNKYCDFINKKIKNDHKFDRNNFQKCT